MHLNRVYYLLFLFIFLWSCANTSSPTGGEGDKTPPKLVSSVPANLATYVTVDEKITIYCSEWIEPTSVKNGIQISPKVDSGVTIDVRGKKIIVSPNSKWQKDRTYHVSANSDLLDYSKNSLEKSTTIVFSTGGSLDSATLQGHVNLDPILKAKPKVGLFLEEHISPIDTSIVQQFDYITQCDSTGYFSFENISESNYKVIAFIDDDANNRVTPGETIFLDSSAISPSGSDTLILTEGQSDTTSLKLDKISPLSPTLCIFTIKEMGKSAIDTLAAQILSKSGDSAASDVRLHLSKDSLFYLINLEKALDRSQFTIVTKIPKPFVDSSATPYYFDSTLFNGREDTDTTAPKLISIKKSSINTSYRFTLEWSIPVNSYNDTLFLSDTNDVTYPFVPEKGLAKNITYKNAEEIPFDTKIILDKSTLQSQSLTGIEYVADSTDTTTFSLQTLSREAVAHSLTIVTDTVYTDCIIKLSSIKSKTEYSLPFTGDTLSIQSPLAGSYRVFIVEDKNTNGHHDKATLFPYNMGEFVHYISDTIKIPPRWEVEHTLSLKPEVVIPIEDADTSSQQN